MPRYIVLPVFTLACVLVVLTAAAQSPDPLLGTWKLNVEKSTASPGPLSKSGVSIWEDLGGGQFKNTQDTVNAKGQSIHTEVITKFDGADAPLKGAAVPTTRAYKRLDGRTTGSPSMWEFVTKVEGKVTTTNKSVVSADGKTRTNTTTGKNAQGQTVNNVAIYDRQ